MLKRIQLKGEQKKVLFLPPTNPIQIKGVAGSGKTTVALYRAKHLLDTQNTLFQEANIAIFTFNKTLSAYISAVRRYINGGYQRDSDELKPKSAEGLQVQVINFHSWAFKFLESNGVKLHEDVEINGSPKRLWKTVTYDKEKIVEFAKIRNITLPVARKSTAFFVEEISWIKGQMLETEEEYLNAKRVGRGTTDRVTRSDKSGIWSIYQSYNARLKELGKYDFDDYALLALKIIDSSGDFKPPFTHIIVDEAQDLSKAQILTISKLVSPETNSISIIADAAQRIYKSGFTWSEVGLEVRGGRTIEFKKNYRNTVQIAEAAISLLSNESDQSDFTEIQNPVRDGDLPVMEVFGSREGQFSGIIKCLSALKQAGQLNSTVILYRTSYRQNDLQSYLEENGFETELVKDYVDYNSDAIKLCPMPSIKGLEFNNVIIIDLNDDVIPYPPGFNDTDDEFHVSTERRLLYTCMTRARSNLFLFSSGNPSPFLNEIDSSLLDVK